MSPQSRYNTRFLAARSPDNEEESLSVPSRDVIQKLLMMREGDSLVVDHVGDLEEGVIYP